MQDNIVETASVGSSCTGNNVYQTAPEEELETQPSYENAGDELPVVPEEVQQDDTAPSSVDALYHTLNTELMINIRKSVSCSLCLSTYTNPVLLPCVHVFCRACIEQSFQQGREKCPLCNQKATRRSLVDAPHFEELARAYKKLSRSLGLAPIEYAPELEGLTQLNPQEEEAHEDIDSQSSQPVSTTPKTNNAPSLVECHQHFQAASTWHQVVANSASSNAPTPKKRQHDLLLQEREQVMNADKRSLINAAVRQKKHRESKSSSPKVVAFAQNASPSSAPHAQAPSDPSDTWPVSPVENENDSRDSFSAEKPSDPPATAASSPHSTRASSQEMHEVSLQDSCEQEAANRSADDMMLEEEDLPDEEEMQDISLQEVRSQHSTPSNSKEMHRASVQKSCEQQTANRSAEMMLEEDDLLNNDTTEEMQDISTRDESGASLFSPNTRENMKRLDEASNDILKAIEKDDAATDAKMKEDDDGMSTELCNLENLELGLCRDLQEQNMKAIRRQAMGTNSSHEDEPSEDGICNETACSQELKEIFHDLPTTETLSPSLQELCDKENIPVPQKDGKKERSSRNSSRGSFTALSQKEEESTLETPPPGTFAVGTVVQVQSRTWPGINKQGGVARIRKVSTEPTVSYDVVYLLGGRESSVDAGFVSLANEEISGTKRDADDCNDAQHHRKSRRIAKQQDEIPPSLLTQLKAEGYATDANAEMKIRRKKQAKHNVVAKAYPAKKERGRSKKAPKNVAKKKERKPAQVPRLTDEEKLVHANARYEKWILRAQSKGVVNVVTSLLPESDQELLQLLYKETKGKGVSIRITPTFNPAKTTICITPVQDSSSSPVISRSRSMKAMKASLAGVPLVSPAWISSCWEKREIILPSADMYIRTLSTRTDQLLSYDNELRLGVAWTAARLHQQDENVVSKTAHVRPLQNVSVYLCGTFQSPSLQKADANELLRASGATILSSPKMAVKKLAEANEESKVVILCDDTTADDCLSKAKALTTHRNREQILVVNAAWLFDSISCGNALSSDYYPPSSTRCKELWRLSQK